LAAATFFEIFHKKGGSNSSSHQFESACVFIRSLRFLRCSFQSSVEPWLALYLGLHPFGFDVFLSSAIKVAHIVQYCFHINIVEIPKKNKEVWGMKS
jgi:hypothetical protein